MLECELKFVMPSSNYAASLPKMCRYSLRKIDFMTSFQPLEQPQTRAIFLDRDGTLGGFFHSDKLEFFSFFFFTTRFIFTFLRSADFPMRFDKEIKCSWVVS